MSQFNAPPPPPPGAMPPGYGQPVGYGQMPVQTKTSVSAILSLVCGILGCIPVITSLLAIVFGFLGLKSASKPGVGGKGFAIAGLILGIIGVLGWAGAGATMYFGWQAAKTQMAQQARPFVDAVIEGDVSKASAFSSLSTEEISSLQEQMAGWGKVTDMSMSGFDMQKSTQRPNSLVMNGTVTFEKAGKKEFEIILDTSGGGPPKIIGVHFK